MRKSKKNIQTIWESEKPELFILETQYDKNSWSNAIFYEDVIADKATVETRPDGVKLICLSLKGRVMAQEWLHNIISCKSPTIKLPFQTMKIEL